MEYLHSVKTLSGKTIVIKIEALGATDRVTTKIQGKNGVSLYKQSLSFDGDRLHDDRTLSNDKVRHHSTFDPCTVMEGLPRPSSSAPKKIYIVFKSAEGRELHISADRSASVNSVRSRIEKHWHVPILDQRFSFDGKRLSGEETFSSLNYEDDGAWIDFLGTVCR